MKIICETCKKEIPKSDMDKHHKLGHLLTEHYGIPSGLNKIVNKIIKDKWITMNKEQIVMNMYENGNTIEQIKNFTNLNELEINDIIENNTQETCPICDVKKPCWCEI